jgi:hypothetical protein
VVAASPERLVFFLGGYDLEMVTIRDLLAEVAICHYYDKNLSWGVRTSAYGEESWTTLDLGQIPVLVELSDDLLLDPTKVFFVDHHGEHAEKNKPTSLH